MIVSVCMPTAIKQILNYCLHAQEIFVPLYFLAEEQVVVVEPPDVQSERA